MEIKKAIYEDLSEILNLQKMAYLSEAELLNDYSIQPLTQTLSELQNEFNKFDTSIILKMVNEENNQIIGSVRAYDENECVHIGKLIIHPDYQNKGLGTKLLKTMEMFFENKTFELFTSSKSEKNIALYKKNGYKEYRLEKANENYDMIFLRK